MMVKPPLKKLENQVDSKYTLVTLAVYEIAEGEVTYKRTKEGIK